MSHTFPKPDSQPSIQPSAKPCLLAVSDSACGSQNRDDNSTDRLSGSDRKRLQLRHAGYQLLSRRRQETSANITDIDIMSLVGMLVVLVVGRACSSVIPTVAVTHVGRMHRQHRPHNCHGEVTRLCRRTHRRRHGQCPCRRRHHHRPHHNQDRQHPQPLGPGRSAPPPRPKHLDPDRNHDNTTATTGSSFGARMLCSRGC